MSRCSFYSSVQSLGVEEYFDRDNITVFAPENGGLDGLPEGTLDYLTTEEVSSFSSSLIKVIDIAIFWQNGRKWRDGRL